MYILLNRENVVVDILAEARYIKLQSSNGIVVACGKMKVLGLLALTVIHITHQLKPIL